MMITLQFSSMSNFGSELIELKDYGPFSHVDSVLPDGTLLGARHDICGNVPPGVQIRQPNYHNFSKVTQITLPTSDVITNNYYAWVQSQIGKPYDSEAILAFITGRNWRTPDSWYCSELVAAGLEQSKYFPYPLFTPANKIAPNILALLLSVQTAFII